MTTRPASLTDLAYREALARERLYTALDALDHDAHDPLCFHAALELENRDTYWAALRSIIAQREAAA